MVELAGNGLWRAKFDAMQEWSEQAVAAARRLEDQGLVAVALSTLALADSMTGLPEQAESDRAEAAALVDALSDDELVRHIGAATWLGGVELYLDRYAEADAHAGRGLAAARASGQGEHLLILVETLGGVWRQRGKLAEAGELLDGGIESARLLGNTHALVWSLSGRSSTALRQGDMELALATAQESVDLGRDGGATFHFAEAAADLAAALLERGSRSRRSSC